MQITKHAHACVEIGDGDDRLLIDPGTFTPNAADLISDHDTILITHEHPDHFSESAIAAALQANPSLQVFGPDAVVGRWSDHGDRVSAVAEGDAFDVGGISIAVYGADHAVIHPDIPMIANVGFLIGGQVYHPGDAYFVPPIAVHTLLLPTSGPWTVVREGVDYVRAVKPDRLIQIHELLLSDAGQSFMENVFSPNMLTPVSLETIGHGDTVEL